MTTPDNDFYKMAIVRNKEECTSEYIAKLHDWIVEHCDEYFNDENKRASSFSDFIYFNKKIDREHLCMPDEVMLIDRKWDGRHSYVICTISAKNKAKDLFGVIAIDEIRKKHWRNGYFLLPKL